jgi:hypothetical protein
MLNNPWVDLPDKPDYVLEADRPEVEKFNKKRKPDSAHYLHIEKILPEAFIGDKNAPVLLLSNNPGFSGQGADKPRQQSFVLEWMRKNLHHERLDYPFYYLDPAFKGNDWWEAKLHYLIEHFDGLGQDGRRLVAKSVLNVVYFPYPSRLFGHLRCRVPSQTYGFDLVRQAMERNAVIIHMRKPQRKCPNLRDIWADEVRGLSKYERRFQVKNTMTPVINENLRDFQSCQRGFQEAIEAIAAFVKTQTACA